MVVRCDLDGQPDTLANVLNKRVSSPVIALSNLVRNDKFCVRVNARPKPIVSALCLIVLRESATVTADILPLLIHFDSDARQITKVHVHVIGERFASLANDSQNGVLPDVKHSRDCVDWRALAECGQY